MTDTTTHKDPIELELPAAPEAVQAYVRETLGIGCDAVAPGDELQAEVDRLRAALGDAKLMSTRHQVLREQAEATSERRTTRMHGLEAGLDRAIEWLSDLSVELTDEGAIRLARLASTLAVGFEGPKGFWYAETLHAETERDEVLEQRDAFHRERDDARMALCRKTFELGCVARPTLASDPTAADVCAVLVAPEPGKSPVWCHSTVEVAIAWGWGYLYPEAHEPGEITWLAPVIDCPLEHLGLCEAGDRGRHVHMVDEVVYDDEPDDARRELMASQHGVFERLAKGPDDADEHGGEL